MVRVFVVAPEYVAPVPVGPFAIGTPPLYHVMVGTGVPVIVDVNVAILATQAVVLTGSVTIGIVLTTIVALATRSFVGTLSTCVFTVALPPVPFEVKVAVAVPFAWIVPTCPERVPSVVGPQVTGNPITLTRSASAIVVPAELV